MSGLFSMLGSATRALEAQRFGLDVTGQNIANVNTPGYTRRRALLAEALPLDPRTGGGVRVEGVTAERSPFLERRVRTETPAEQREAALAGALHAVELAVGDSGNGLNERLTAFFDAFSRLADAPTSSTARQEVILQGRTLAGAFNDLGTRFAASQQEADTDLRAAVDHVNTLATRVAGVNRSLGQVDASSPQALHLRDQVRGAVEELTRLTSVEAIERPDGGFDLAVGGGRALVIGDNALPLSAVSQPVTGFADIVTDDGTVITSQVTSGRIGGLLHARDTLVPGYLGALDELAHAVVTEVNALHTAGFDAAGTAGLPFFQPLGGVAGAASLVTMNAALLAPGGEALVAASNVATAAGDNGAARAIHALRDGRVLAGNTATVGDAWGRLVYRVGRDVQAARDEQGSRAELLRQVTALRDSVSGVSMDEEAANLMRFQRAYEANARYFRSVDESIATLLQMVGG